MAHADYNCCAICDCKIKYAGRHARTKKDICGKCLVELKKIDIHNINGFKKYIKKSRYDDLKELLLKLDYSFCWYGNEIDDLILSTFFPNGMAFKKYIERIGGDE